MNLREQFEARFPVPAGVAWSDEYQNYGWIKKKAFQRAITYRALWTGWQESRADLVVTLPRRYAIDPVDGLVDSDGGPLAFVADIRTAIEANGLKVTP